jgi:type II secretory pathway component GspD/PulD (secretin)
MFVRLLIASLAAALPFAPAVAGPHRPATPVAPDAAVVIEVRFISVADDFFERIGVDFSRDGEKMKPEVIRNTETPIFLDENQLRKFLESAEGDIRTNIVQAPKMVVSDGKRGSIRCTKQQHYVTGMNTVRQGETFTISPKCEEHSTGFELSARPKITADKSAVAVSLKASLTGLDCEKEPVCSVFVPAATVNKDGKPEKPVVNTQYLPPPRFSTLALATELTIPDGGTMVLGGWKRVSEGRNEFGPPVASKIPYVNRLFRNVGYTRSSEQVMVIVTARIISLDESKPVKAASTSAK